MTCKILNGNWLSEQYARGVGRRVEALVKSGKRPPGLGVILVGDNPASLAYVGRKGKVAQQCGFVTKDLRMAEQSSFEEVASAIDQFNSDPEIDGILLQLPVPKHLSAERLIDRILPSKDADGLHPVNQGLLLRGGSGIRPCTPAGSMRLIDLAYSDIECVGECDVESEIPEVDLSGKQAVVIGRSILVGKAVAMLLLERNATVTIAHSRTADLQSVIQNAEIVVAAVGRPFMIPGEWIRPGAVVIDVGINRVLDQDGGRGRLVGDVDTKSAAEHAKAITPVPGGVGPMTVIMLMRNTFQAYEANTAL